MHVEKDKLEGHISEVRPGRKGRYVWLKGGFIWFRDKFTSHVLFALEHYESVTSVGLLLLVRLFMSMRINNDSNLRRWLAQAWEEWGCGAAYALNRSKPTKLLFQITLISVVA